jgi:hypothetical protein
MLAVISNDSRYLKVAALEALPVEMTATTAGFFNQVSSPGRTRHRVAEAGGNEHPAGRLYIPSQR